MPRRWCSSTSSMSATGSPRMGCLPSTRSASVFSGSHRLAALQQYYNARHKTHRHAQAVVQQHHEHVREGQAARGVPDGPALVAHWPHPLLWRRLMPQGRLELHEKGQQVVCAHVAPALLVVVRPDRLQHEGRLVLLQKSACFETPLKQEGQQVVRCHVTPALLIELQPGRLHDSIDLDIWLGCEAVCDCSAKSLLCLQAAGSCRPPHKGVRFSI